MDRFQAGATRLIEGDDPLRVLARLVDTEVFSDYVVCEGPAEVRLACDPVARVTVESGRLRLWWSGSSQHFSLDGPILPQVGMLLNTLELERWTAYGYAAFELGTAADAKASVGPLLDLIIPATEVRIIGSYAHIRSLDESRLSRMLRSLAEAEKRRDDPCGTIPIDLVADQRLGYEAAVRRAMDCIARNELQKVIISRRVSVPFDVDMPRTFTEGHRQLNPKRSFLLHLGGVQAVGFSPETVIEVTADGRVTAQPLAGTRACGTGPDGDARLRRDLLTNAKEVYEHALSVQTAHAELAGLCRRGSISLDEFLAVRQRGSVQHLATTLRGTLSAGRSAWDAADVMFPAVTASGIPKRDACRAIARLEGSARRLYGGAVLVAEAGGTLDAALILRAVVDDGQGPFLQAGAGIVAGSDPSREFIETCEKMTGVARCIVPRRGISDDTAALTEAGHAMVSS